MNKPTVTIGIPAYNEEANIHHVLQSLLTQQQEEYVLKEIIVISDGSSDETAKQAGNVRDPRIRVINQPTRRGINQCLNALVSQASGDIMILVNADIAIPQKTFIQEMIRPFQDNKHIALTGGAVQSVAPTGLFEWIMATSADLRNDIYKRIKQGNNIYMCHGRARAFSQKFYQTIRWPDDCPEDAFSYLLCLQKGHTFVYVPTATVLFRSSGTLSDHKKQSFRFAFGKRDLERYFPPEWIQKQFFIPAPALFQSLAKFLLTRPIPTIAYLSITLSLRLFPQKSPIDQSKWDMALSSKKFIRT